MDDEARGGFLSDNPLAASLGLWEHQSMEALFSALQNTPLCPPNRRPWSWSPRWIWEASGFPGWPKACGQQLPSGLFGLLARCDVAWFFSLVPFG